VRVIITTGSLIGGNHVACFIVLSCAPSPLLRLPSRMSLPRGRCYRTAEAREYLPPRAYNHACVPLCDIVFPVQPLWPLFFNPLSTIVAASCKGHHTPGALLSTNCCHTARRRASFAPPSTYYSWAPFFKRAHRPRNRYSAEWVSYHLRIGWTTSPTTSQFTCSGTKKFYRVATCARTSATPRSGPRSRSKCRPCPLLPFRFLTLISPLQKPG
jgi:hypothetical protein